MPIIFQALQQPRPLSELVIAFVNYGNQDAEQECLAQAVYFEARSESLEGQLAVADVVLNRAASGIYPPGICDVVTQPAQFSFIRGGRFPPVDRSSRAWHRALAIADIARKDLAQVIPPNVLWYHADYVAPSWGRRLTRVAQIGTHIFYS
ncbi:MAG TPA: cell wall hydrolase [Allosphingosinicella sp.]|nr:cell wall hydrolase [Allosphingosinicella sp.]